MPPKETTATQESFILLRNLRVRRGDLAWVSAEAVLLFGAASPGPERAWTSNSDSTSTTGQAKHRRPLEASAWDRKHIMYLGPPTLAEGSTRF